LFLTLTEELHVGLTAERRVLAVAARHELAHRTSVTLEMASDYRLPIARSAPDYWFDAYIPPYSPGGRTIERSVAVGNNEEVLALTSTGEIVMTSESAAGETNAAAVPCTARAPTGQ